VVDGPPDGIKRARMRVAVESQTKEGRPWNRISRIGMDTSKYIFQLHGVNTAEQPVFLRKKLRRKGDVRHSSRSFAADGWIAIEACGASHHLCAACLQSFGHSVKVDRAAARQRPYIKRGKETTRAGTPKALCRVRMSRPVLGLDPGMRFRCRLKTAEQAGLMLVGRP